jgi:hypothetical protein
MKGCEWNIMSITSTDKIFSVNDSEYGYAVDSFHPVSAGKTINLYVPKIMGDLIKDGSETISTSKIFDNASDCKPVYATKVQKIKSLPVTVKENCNWLDKLNSKGYIPKDSMFVVEFLNGNISTPYATTK